MRHILLTLIIITTISNTLRAQYKPDILGEDFEQMTIVLEADDYSDTPIATLVRRVPRVDEGRAILYIHGYNDYFFHEELAQRSIDSRYDLYALDLRRYGRSIREEDSPFEIRQIEEYFEEIGLAIAQMRREGVEDITLMGHSTGGLIASLYCHSHRENPQVDRLILNSPFFAMNMNPVVVTLATPIIKLVGAIAPRLKLFSDSSTTYSESLSREHHGEWSFDPRLKMPLSPPYTAGWVRAILQGHSELQRGLSIDIPILLIYSDRSIITSEWSEECQYTDIVLNVKDIARYGTKIGSKVSCIEVERGMHDLLLSQKDVRKELYDKIFEWIKDPKDNGLPSPR